MKTRNGFVSNSSSSSFLLYGWVVEQSDLIEKLKEKGLLTEEEAQDTWDAVYKLEELEEFKSSGLDLQTSDEWDDHVYLGKSWSQVEDDETGKEFKENIEKSLQDIFGAEVKCATHQHAWRDG